MKEGFIIRANAGLYDVFNGNDIVSTRARGKFRIGKYSPSVGDFVLYDEKQNYLMDIKQRTNELMRPSIVNVENVYVIASLDNPRIQLSLMYRYILISEIIHVKPKIILTKYDLCNDDYASVVKEKLNKLGYEVFIYSSKTSYGLEEIKKELKDKKVVFFGQSGVGKSSLINLLIPGSKQKTNEISQALGRGKHTTRVVEYLRYNEGWICDTPGFSSIEFDIDPVDVASFYPGLDKLYDKCKYNDCTHDHESKCAVKDAVKNGLLDKELYEDYLLLLNDIKLNKKVF